MNETHDLETAMDQPTTGKPSFVEPGTSTREKMRIVIEVSPELVAELNDLARDRRVSLEKAVVDILHERFPATAPLIEPRDEWGRRLREAASNCGVSLSDWDVSREGIYE